jgi:hypothetical protein
LKSVFAGIIGGAEHGGKLDIGSTTAKNKLAAKKLKQL